MQIRKSIVANQFYPGQHDSCVDEINQYLDAAALNQQLPDTVVAGIVPHAGWTFSGNLAAMTFQAVKQQHEKVHTFIIFGAAHGYFDEMPAVCDKGYWETPLGQIAVDEELADAVANAGPVVRDCHAHQSEHSIEVQVPFIQYLFTGAKILPILVPPTEKAVMLGTNVGRIIEHDSQKKIVCIGSTDLTHYGPRYGFTPMGIGRKAIQWAFSVNDKKLIDLAIALDGQGLLASAAENCNACGPGAAAATVAAAQRLGSAGGLLLSHTNSSDVMLSKMGVTSTDSVGYAAMIF